ncbi:MAG: hypothetical protein Q9180_006105, partial [Flavoplaca navasiana]
VSRLYDNIGIDELASLLGLNADKAEGYAARMLEQGRIAGSIDQIDRLIVFDGLESSAEGGVSGQKKVVAGKGLRKWDSRVQGVAEELERVASMVQSQYPDFSTDHMVH